VSTAKQSTLTDLQLLILSKASQRDDHAIELPPNLKGSAASKVVKKLTDAGLVDEIAATPGLPVWRRDDAGQAFALIITRSAFEALGVESDSDTDTSPAVPSTDKEGRKGRKKGTRARSPSKAEVPAQTAGRCAAKRNQTGSHHHTSSAPAGCDHRRVDGSNPMAATYDPSGADWTAQERVRGREVQR
jgi:hypothetical protein